MPRPKREAPLASAPMSGPAEQPAVSTAQPQDVPPSAPGVPDLGDNETMTLQQAASMAPMSSTTFGSMGSGPGEYEVTLNCPTPLAHRTLKVKAVSPADAEKQYFEANGISGSQHAISIRRVA
jgi:hypothetical protein